MFERVTEGTTPTVNFVFGYMYTAVAVVVVVALNVVAVYSGSAINVIVSNSVVASSIEKDTSSPDVIPSAGRVM